MCAAVPRRFEAPGKVFLLGEYSVLAGGPGLLAGVRPSFSLKTGAGSFQPHPESPAGRLLSAHSERPWSAEFQDPYLGEGGFGASSAQFLLTGLALGLEGWAQDWRVPFAAFRAQAAADAGAGWPPSGADLVAQALGGCVLFHPAPDSSPQVTPPQPPTAEALEGAAPVLGRVMLFSAAGIADRKVATHEHLATLSRDVLTAERLARWKSITLDGAGALASGNAAGFGAALSAYARELAAAGLERPEARADREALSDLKGVAGVKGMGALLSDGVLVCLRAESGPSVRSEVQEVAFNRGLRLVADGIRLAPGALSGSTRA